MTPARYAPTMIAIHWTTAVLMVATVVLAWVIPRDHTPVRDALLLLHRSCGIGVLALTVVRLAVRHAVPAPAEAAVPRLQALAARATHLVLYAILLAMPVSGYLYSTSRGNPVSVFGLFELPPLLSPSETLRQVVWSIHSNGQIAVYVVIGLHAAAALYHLLVRRDAVMARMVPGLRLMPPAAARPGAR